MQDLLQRVQVHVDRERHISEQLKKTREEVGKHTFRDVEEFPLDANGQVVWDQPQEVAQLMRQINRFLEYDQVFSGGRAMAKWPGYLKIAFPFMAEWTLESMIAALVIRCWFHRQRGVCTLEYIELFCGTANLSKAAIQLGLTGVSLDQTANCGHNLLEQEGLQLWILAVTATIPGALEWVASPCNSFVILCRAQSDRQSWNHYIGNQDRLFVLEGNTLGDLSGLLLFLGFLLELMGVLEQPTSSVLPDSACCAAVLRFMQAEKVVTYHYAFGGATLKPLQLWSPARGVIRPLYRDYPAEASSAYNGLAVRDGSGGFTGQKTELRESQQYSREFGLAVVRAFLANSRH